MNTGIKKSISDLKINPGRTILVIFALVIGLWGVGSTLISFVILKNDLKENFTKTVPAHVIMVSENFNRLDLNDFRKRHEIENAEFRDLSIQRIEVFPDKWIPLWIYGVEDFNHFNLAKVFYQAGEKIPKPGTILIERDSLMPRVSSLKIGSNARVRVGGKITHVPVSGIGFDPAQAPSTQDAFIYAYTDKNSYSMITGEMKNQRLIFRIKNVSSKIEVQKAVEKIRNDFNQKGIVIKSMQIPKFNEHPHQFQMNTLLMINGVIGFLAFIMAAVMVSQLMAAILARQIRQIGILKAIGASRLQILKIYLAMIIILGAISGVIAIPLAVATGYGYSGFVAMILNFDILTNSLPHHLYVFLIFLSLLMPILLSLPALLKGTKIPVHDAISDYGINQNVLSVKTKKLSLIPIPHTLNLALRNTMRNKKRLIVTIAAMSLGVAIFSTGFNVRQSLVEFLANSRKAMKYDVQVVFKEPIPRDKALSYFNSLENVARVETWNGGKGRLQTGISSTTNGIGIVALPHDTDLMKWNMIDGRWLKPSGEIEMVMNQQAVEAYGNPMVDNIYHVNIRGKKFPAKLVGIAREFDVAKIYIDQKQFDMMVNPDHKINSLMFTASDNSYKKIIKMKENIEKIIAVSDLDILYVMSQAERSQIIYDHLNIILMVLAFLAFLVLVVSALGMSAAASISIMERTREIGVMRAIGASPGKIYNLFVSEGMIVSILSILAGVTLSLPLSMTASAFFGYLILGANTPLDFAFSFSGFIITLITSLSFGWLASRIPARNAIKISTREALAYE